MVHAGRPCDDSMIHGVSMTVEVTDTVNCVRFPPTALPFLDSRPAGASGEQCANEVRERERGAITVAVNVLQIGELALSDPRIDRSRR